MKKTAEETIVVDGTREDWLRRCQQAALDLTDLSNVKCNDTLFQIEAKWTKILAMPPHTAELQVTLIPASEGRTEIRLKASADTGAEWFLITRPQDKIIPDFKAALTG